MDSRGDDRDFRVRLNSRDLLREENQNRMGK